MDKLLAPFISNITKALGAKSVISHSKMQSLWSDYGAIFRLRLEGALMPTVVAKCIILEKSTQHPRGWASTRSHQRKLKSYQVENCWYENFVASLPASVKVPKLLYSQQSVNAQVLVLEDLSTNFPNLKQDCTLEEAKTVVRWLAQFHAHFLNQAPEGLWTIGSYWHLDTRPEEWQAMENGALKEKAAQLDTALNQAKYQTIIHGDAKVANFCFGENGAVAAVDFQYVGKGIGVKDLAYFIGSCFTDEACQRHESTLVDFYFDQLLASLSTLNNAEKKTLENEWRGLYPVAWADFNRFLMGWLPSHQKLHSHALSKNAAAFKYLNSK